MNARREAMVDAIAAELLSRRNRGRGRGEGCVTSNRATAREGGLRAVEALEALGALPVEAPICGEPDPRTGNRCTWAPGHGAYLEEVPPFGHGAEVAHSWAYRGPGPTRPDRWLGRDGEA